MKKTMKKVLSVFIAILMIVTTVPMAFAAEGDTKYLYLKISDGNLSNAMTPDLYVRDDAGNEIKHKNEAYIGNDTYSYKIPADIELIYWDYHAGGGVVDDGLPFFELPDGVDTYYYDDDVWYCLHQNGASIVEDEEAYKCEICDEKFRDIYLDWYLGWHSGSVDIGFYDSMGNELPYEFNFIEDNFDLYRVSVDAVSYRFDFSSNGTHEGTIPEKVDYYEAATRTWSCSHRMGTSGKQTCKGYLCEICDEFYGEADTDAHDWSNFDGSCLLCGYACDHETYTNEVCDICGWICDHTSVNVGQMSCDYCGRVIDLAEITVGKTVQVNDTIVYKFTPEYSGTYIVSSSIAEEYSDPCVELYKGNVYIDKYDDCYDENGEIIDYDFNFTYNYEAGQNYYLAVVGLSRTYGFTVTVECETHNWSEGKCLACGYVCDHSEQTGSACEICGATLHTCDFTGEWKYDSEKHWKECECGLTGEEGSHSFTDGKCECDKISYDFIHQPTAEEPYVELEYNEGTSYQWYKTTSNEITDDKYAFPESEYVEGKGWISTVPGYFAIELKAGDTVDFEFSEHCDAFAFTLDAGLSDFLRPNGKECTVTVDVDGTYYAILLQGSGYIRAYLRDSEPIAVDGENESILKTSEIGTYMCEVTFADGTKVKSDSFELIHTCDFTGEWKHDSEKHWKECECGETEEVAHSYIDGVCECGTMGITNIEDFGCFPDDGWYNEEGIPEEISPNVEGKIEWVNGDEITITMNSETYGTQTAVMTYQDGSWVGDIALAYDENEDLDYLLTVAYGKVDGTEEYLLAGHIIDGSTLQISFEYSDRVYSRLRLVGDANESYEISVTEFMPAGSGNLDSYNYTLTADDNGNAFLYGYFAEGSILTINGVDCTLNYLNGTISGKSYAICAVHSGTEATCKGVLCENCGLYFGEKDLSKHTLVQVDAKAPTCSAAGYEAYEYCTACDYTTKVEIPAVTHTDANCDYKCDYNCGYVYETLDFSDAKVLTTVDGVLYIDGVEAETNSSKSQSRIYEGKYILEGDIETSRYIWIFGDTYLDLNGYTWNLTDKYINVNAPLSVYDTSEAETGKITSASSNLTININNVAAGFNFYGGTIENTSSSGRCVLDVSWADVNLYAGKIKSNSQAISFVPGQEITLNIDGTVLESGDDYADVLVALGINAIAKGDIDVTDYKGDSLTAKVNVISTLGKITVFKGIKNTQEAEKYQIIDVVCNESFDLFWEKTEYDEATGEKSIYTANNAFTQQPSADNNLTVDFNNTAATFQWYEVEEKNLGVYTAEEISTLFTYEFKAGDTLKVSTDSELRHLVIEAGNEYINLLENEKTATITFDADTTVDLFVAIVNADNPVEVNFTVFKEAKLDGETEKTLQKVECGKSYYCKATVGENVYVSDKVNILPVEHNLIQVDAKAPTCTEIGWDAYEYCTACDYTTYEELPVDADAHDWSNKDGVCAYGCGTVCDHAGQTGSACEICGTALHTCDFTGEWKYDSEKHWKECECGETEEVAHSYTEGVCDECGYECLHGSWTDGTCDACGYDCEHAFDTDANIMTALTCERCGYTYKSDKRWAEGVYETYYNGLVAMLNSYYYDDDEIVAYFALDTVDGEESSISFDWAINQGFTEYGEFSLHFYHNGIEVITHDFGLTANPYDNILSEEYKFTAEGETQIFKFVFNKDDFGYWYDDGRTAYLNIKDHSHVFGEATDTQPASCKTCNKTQCEIAGHDWSNLDNVCAVCGYECSHEDTYNNLIRPVQNADGTWGKGKIVEICNNCGNSSLVQEVERDHEGYKVFDETAAELEAILNSGKMTDTWKNDYTNRLNGLRNSAYYQVYTEIETAIPSMTESLKSIIAEIEAGLADGTMIKADFTYMTSLFDEINALIDNDPNKLIPSESGRFQGIYYGYYMSCKNNGNHSQADYDQNMADNNWEGQIEDILAGIKDGTALKADYTEIDEAIAALDEKLADVNLTDEAKAGLEEIKADLEEMKKNPLSSKADLAVLEKALEDYETELDAGIEDGTALKADYTEIDEAIAALDEKLADVNLTDEAKAGLEEIKSQLEEMKNNPLSSKADVEELMNALDSFEEDVEDGTIVLVDASEILEEYDIARSDDLEEKYGKEKVDEVFFKIHIKNPGVIDSVWEYAESITGTVAETADEIEELKARVDALYAAIERCIIGTHNVEEYEVVSPAKCGTNAIESGTCTFCCDVITREVENSALTHSFTKYKEAVAPTCDKTGVEVASCDNGCNATDERVIPATNHKGTLVEVDAKAAACDAIGWEAYEYCTACDYTTYKEISATNHKDTLVKVDAKAAACDAIGWEAYEYCTACNYTTYKEIPATNHKDTLVKVDAKAATCDAIGWEAYEYCTACEYTTYKEIPATNHKGTLVEVDAKAATCDAIGWEAYEYCTACDYTTYKEIPATNHKDTLVEVDAKAATCDAIGWEAYEYCTACNYTTYKEIPATNHKDTLVKVDAKAAACDAIGWEAYEYCTACDYTTYKEISATNHKGTLVKADAKAATCDAIGWEAYEYCTACDYTTYKEIPAAGHSYDAEETKSATCTEEGTMTYTCSNCGDVYTEEIAALGHNFADYISNEDATCDADGTKTAECANGCGEADTVTDEGSKLGHTDEDGDKICDVCEDEIAEACPFCGGEAHDSEIAGYVCLLINLIKLIILIAQSLGIIA